MTLTLGDERFALKTGILSAQLTDAYWTLGPDIPGGPGILWGLEVDVEEQGDFPRFTCDTIRFSVRRWTDLSGNIVHFQAPYSYLDNPRAMSVMNMWDDMPRATLQILERTGDHFRFHWEGICRVETEVPFFIEGQALFRDLQAWGTQEDTAETFTQRLSSYIDTNEFLPPSVDPCGPDRSYCVFKPKV